MELVRSFVATASADSGADGLRTREGAAAWLRSAGLLPAEAGLTNSEHSALVRLRDAVRDVLAADSGVRADAAARLTKALADGRLVVTIDASGSARLATAARSSYPSVVAAIAIAIAESGGAWRE